MEVAWRREDLVRAAVRVDVVHDLKRRQPTVLIDPEPELVRSNEIVLVFRFCLDGGSCAKGDAGAVRRSTWRSIDAQPDVQGEA
jgi:hypothetical protein